MLPGQPARLPLAVAPPALASAGTASSQPAGTMWLAGVSCRRRGQGKPHREGIPSEQGSLAEGREGGDIEGKVRHTFLEGEHNHMIPRQMWTHYHPQMGPGRLRMSSPTQNS